MVNLQKIITWVIVVLIIPTLVFEIGAYYVNQTTTYDLPTIYGAYTRDPQMEIENVYLLDNVTGEIKDEIIRGSSIRWGSVIAIRIDISINLPLTLSQYEITPHFDISDIFANAVEGISEPIEIGFSNIFIKEKSTFLVFELPLFTTYTGLLDINLRNPDGVLIIQRLFEFAVVP